MRIKFIEDVPVDIKDVPAASRGALGIRHATIRPRFESGKVEMKSEPPPSKHFYPKGWAAELPAELAQIYLDSGTAETVGHKVIVVDSETADLYDGMYSAEDRDLLLAGVISGYRPGSKPNAPLYAKGTNWDAWEAAKIEVTQ